jgi:hypothetical protein
MLGQIRSKLTYANVVATIAVFIALGGGAYAATALRANSVGTAQLKNRAVTGRKIAKNAIDGSKVKNGSLTAADINLATLPKWASATNSDHAAKADSATTAANAAHADVSTRADRATAADSATNSANLGGAPAASYMQTVAKSGQVLTGQLSVKYVANDPSGFTVTGGSYPVALPAGVATPTLVWTTSTTPDCPGQGQAAAGTLCVYEYNSTNVSSISYSGNFNGSNKRFGFSVDVFPTNTTLGGYLIATWAYKVP